MPPDTAPLDTVPAAARRHLRDWYRRSGRDFPWRKEKDPYRLIVTEVMLIRTRASQVERLRAVFFARFPDFRSLAIASEGEVEEAIRPFGLLWRADLLLRLARAAIADPGFWASEGVPALGPYVRGATQLSLDGKGSLPIDVTIARVLARYHGLSPRSEPRRDREVRAAADAWGRVTRDEFHALLDVAALVCTPTRPYCEECPLVMTCKTARANKLSPL